MQKVVIFDRTKNESTKIRNFAFWKASSEFQLLDREIGENLDLDMVFFKDAQIVLLVLERGDEKRAERIIETFASECKIIILSTDNSYESVRHFFTLKIYDYLILPLSEGELEKSLGRILEREFEEQIIHEIQPALDALVDIVIEGNDSDENLIRLIVSQIFHRFQTDKMEAFNKCRQIKIYVYKLLSERESWLSKFILKEDLTPPYAAAESCQEMIQQWISDFKEIKETFKKYKMTKNSQVLKIVRFILNHVDERLSLKEISREVSLNPSYISYVFKKTSGVNFVDFLTGVKIDRAKILLKDSSMRIGDVASTLGYINQEYFSRNFKKMTGLSPVSYKKMQEAESA